MNITKTTGCMAYSTRVDGNDINDLSQFQLDEAFELIVARIRTSIITASKLESLLEEIPSDEYTSTKEPCESCGDYVDTHTWKL
jgi:hypothetical protein